ncbi:ribosomal large subunit (23S rRNA) pseudouridine synthase C (plasmid) [Legionella adelaidensis]|uniref:Pseudouridine synthase n=1 Tax=Legionella adelaidensis TaxID=45056 RepID=A0A0W0R2Z7_9GAMM|nr:RluA family pseudouridine synthase [Legionella adelaidensis]KTC65457.1 ribosomal large subunit (23S rRNA) pseudouridine synthase C [Legionella adelaidensis]VEH84722.1 ribosomal large subunit (23S rRNA) pseudouridine synthase C [Legionella adelaidensis]
MGDVRYTEINAEEEGQRLDNYLLRILKGVPKSRIYRIIRAGEVRVNKKRAQASTRLSAGDIIRIPPVRMSSEEIGIKIHSHVSQRLNDCILYEDNHLLVLNKPAGMAVHGGSGLSLGIIEALRKIRADIPYLELVHRLDKETSGCLILAKRRSTLRALHALLEKREVTKIYWALLVKPWKGKKVVDVDVSLEKNTLQSGERMVVVNPQGKASRTTFKLLENFSRACLVEATPKTGRTHQIRVHSAHLGHPILGDEKYGGELPIPELKCKLRRLYLHAHSIHFTLNEKEYSFVADLDDRFSNTLTVLRELKINE